MRAAAPKCPVLILAALVAASLLGRPGARAGAAPTSGAPRLICPRTLSLQTVAVGVVPQGSGAEDLLRAACIQASQNALAAWRLEALASGRADVRACAAQMGAQGCLMGQASSAPHCPHSRCPLRRACAITLIRFASTPRDVKASKPVL